VPLRTPICDMLDIDQPIFLAGMGGVAYANVCAAVSEAGGFGSLGMAGASPNQIKREMRAVRKLTDKPFGVDLLAALPDAVMAAIDVIIDEGASAFIAGLGVPEPVIGRCHEAGVKVFSMCGRVAHATRAEEAGCDVVVAQGTEAGGHTGRVAGMALIPQIVDAVDIPVLAAGSIIDGRGLAAALAFGAQGIWMGTRYIASSEANAHELYKERIAEMGSDDTMVSRGYSGKPMRVIRNQYIEDLEQHPERMLRFPEQMSASSRDGLIGMTPGSDVDLTRSCLPAGQGAGGISDIRPCAEIMASVMKEARETIERLASLA
jgi:enoyl-[acyl-carrier protein] reductase II